MDDIAGSQRLFTADTCAVDEGAVGALVIPDPQRFLFLKEQCVSSGNFRQPEAEVALRIPPDQKGQRLEANQPPLPWFSASFQAPALRPLDVILTHIPPASMSGLTELTQQHPLYQFIP
ncbi:MAG: hypothetical protein V2J11_01120 [Desulfofustis sp.]|nr:hypothetical protein [Desulfofustis sp.]